MSPAASRELDLTEEPESGQVVRPVERPYDPSPERERVRGYIAIGLTAAVIAFAALVTVLVACNLLSVDEVEKLELYFTPLVALSGTALGFYFGGHGGR